MKALVTDCDEELTVIDEKIRRTMLQLLGLKEQRNKLLAKKKDVDMDIVLQCIAEKGLSPNEVLDLINNVAQPTET